MVFYFIYILHGLFLEKILLMYLIFFCITASSISLYAVSTLRCGAFVSQSIFNGSKRSRRAPGAMLSATA